MKEYPIPRYTQAALDAYAEEKRPVGGFLYCVLTNDLFGSIGKADHNNQRALVAICQYIWNELPATCWGSKEKVKTWLNNNEYAEFSNADNNE